jgi:hypothetical protein
LEVTQDAWNAAVVGREVLGRWVEHGTRARLPGYDSRDDNFGQPAILQDERHKPLEVLN